MTELDGFMFTQEVADFARCSTETVRRAATAWQRSGGKTGLKTWQRTVNTEHRFLMADVLDWLSRASPSAVRSKRRAARPSRAA